MNHKRSLVRRTAAVAAAGAAALVLAACGGNGDSSAGHDGHTSKSPSASASASQGQHNAADVAFAKAFKRWADCTPRAYRMTKAASAQSAV